MAENTEQYVPDDEDMAHWFEGEKDPEQGRKIWDTWLTAHDARVRAEARSDALMEAAGLWHGFDLNPTVMPGMNDGIWWTMHLQRLDSTWRRHLTGMAERAQEDQS